MSGRAVIGLEVHAQLSTRTKLFCSCSAEFGAPPNTHVCPVCLGLPGALPVANRRAVEFAVRIGLALGCEVAAVSRFARKSYFYPDCPKNYQITQYDEPLCSGGAVDAGAAQVRIERVHLEEDAAKLTHPPGSEFSDVDMNRSGVALAEIVTGPDLRTPTEAGTLLRHLRSVLRYLGVCDGNMEEGSLRCDVNVSVEDDRGEPGSKVEVKNLNSFRQVEDAIAWEIAVQSRTGGVTPCTKLWDVSRGETVEMRGKEAAQDYRYFPEPDLPPVRVSRDRVAEIRAAIPELPDARRARLVRGHAIPQDDARLIVSDRETADFFEAVVARGADAREAAKWVVGDVRRAMSERGVGIDGLGIPPRRLADLIALRAGGVLSTTAARRVFDAVVETGREPRDLMRDLGLERLDDAGEIRRVARAVVGRHAREADRYRAGKTGVLQFLVGRVMRETGGRADPALAADIVKTLLEGDG